jgi:hypothetical protein
VVFVYNVRSVQSGEGDFSTVLSFDSISKRQQKVYVEYPEGLFILNHQGMESGGYRAAV